MFLPVAASRPIFWENVVCSGTELTLLDCSYDSTRDGNDHSRDMIVHCQQRKVTQNLHTRKRNTCNHLWQTNSQFNIFLLFNAFKIFLFTKFR